MRALDPGLVATSVFELLPARCSGRTPPSVGRSEGSYTCPSPGGPRAASRRPRPPVAAHPSGGSCPRRSPTGGRWSRPRALRVAGGSQVAVPPQGLRADLAQKAKRRPPRQPRGGLPDPEPPDGMGRGLAEGAGVRPRVGEEAGADPVLRTSKVAFGRRPRVENDMRYLAGLPLVLEKTSSSWASCPESRWASPMAKKPVSQPRWCG
jgi:hypothetical protein